jgi:hypothetical protein
MLGKFGPKSDKIGAYRGAFVYQEPFKKDSFTASRVINEVVLELRHGEVRRIPLLSTSVNKGRRPEPNNGLGSLVTTLLLPTPHYERAPLIFSFLRRW